MQRKIGKTAALVAALVALLVVAFAPAAQADRGLIKAFGEYGTGADEFAWTGPVAVDPTDSNATYVVDYKGGEAFGPPPGARVRKFDRGGNLLATAELPTAESGPESELVTGIAVDGSEHRLYVLISGNGADTS